VLRDNPSGVRSVILDSVYPPDVNLFTGYPANTLGALDALFITCSRDAACGTTYADVRGLLFETVTALNADPVRLTIRDTRTGTTYENVRFDGDLLLDTLIDFMYDSDLLPYVPFLITEASEGNLQSFAAYLGYHIGRQGDISNGMYLAVQCREELAFTERGAIMAALRQMPELDDYTPAGIQGADYIHICATFGTDRAGEIENLPVYSDVPALLLTGRYDPVTPPHWAYHAAETLSNSVVIELPGDSHAVSVGAGCGQRLLVDFVHVPSGEGLDTSCVDALDIDFYRAKPTEAAADHF
jgi:pimeloyl-ACP methyl ester carboxylesterase